MRLFKDCDVKDDAEALYEEERQKKRMNLKLVLNQTCLHFLLELIATMKPTKETTTTTTVK